MLARHRLALAPQPQWWCWLRRRRGVRRNRSWWPVRWGREPRGRQQRQARLPRLGGDASHGLEQLGCVWHHPHRETGEGAGRLHGGTSASVRLEDSHRGHPVVRAGFSGARLPSQRATRDGRVRSAPACPEPLPLGSERLRLQAARRVRARQGPAIRHPSHARHPSTCRGAEPARQGDDAACRRHRQQGQHLSLEPRHVRCRHDQARGSGVLRLGVRAHRLLGRGLRQGGRHQPAVPRQRARDRSHPQGHRPHRAPHGAQPLARRDGAHRGGAREAPRQHVADQRRLLGQLAGTSLAVHAPSELERTPSPWALGRCRHAAAWASSTWGGEARTSRTTSSAR